MTLREDKIKKASSTYKMASSLDVTKYRVCKGRALYTNHKHYSEGKEIPDECLQNEEGVKRMLKEGIIEKI